MNIKIVHLLSGLNLEKEQKSIKDLTDTGMPYKQMINTPHDGYCPPSYRGILDQKGTARQYGCYLAHKNAFEQEFSDDLDALLVCEGDCMVGVEKHLFSRLIELVVTDGNALNLYCVSIGAFCDNVTAIAGTVLSVTKMICTQSVLYLRQNKKNISKIFREAPWEPFDVFLETNFGKISKLGVTDKRYTSQYSGPSLINGLAVEFSDRIDPKGLTNFMIARDKLGGACHHSAPGYGVLGE